MNIYITGLGSGYEVEHLVRLFYPMAPLTLTPPEDGADCVWAEKRPDKLWAMVRQGGKSQTAEAPLPIPVEEGGETPEFALASLTYDLLRSWTGIRPPWGKMTGVRRCALSTTSGPQAGRKRKSTISSSSASTARPKNTAWPRPSRTCRSLS